MWPYLLGMCQQNIMYIVYSVFEEICILVLRTPD